MVRTFLFNLPLGCALSIICIHKSCLLQCGVVFIKKRHIIDCERNLNYINVCDLAVASCATKWRGYEFETALKYGLCTWMNFKFYFFGGGNMNTSHSRLYFRRNSFQFYNSSLSQVWIYATIVNTVSIVYFVGLFWTSLILLTNSLLIAGRDRFLYVNYNYLFFYSYLNYINKRFKNVHPR